MSKQPSKTLIEKVILVHVVISVLSAIPLFLFKSTQIAPYLRMITYYCLIIMGLLLVIRPSDKLIDKIFGVMLLIIVILKIINKWY